MASIQARHQRVCTAVQPANCGKRGRWTADSSFPADCDCEPTWYLFRGGGDQSRKSKVGTRDQAVQALHVWETEGRLMTTELTPARHPDCQEEDCKGVLARHVPCRQCGKTTCGKGLEHTDHTGRRRMIWLCGFQVGDNVADSNLVTCARAYHASPRQTILRGRRTRLDWRELTDPLREDRIIPDQMTEQYPAPVREAVRAFIALGANYATVPGLAAAQLQSCIRTLGLEGKVYAEQRGNTTVLRRARKHRVKAVA